MTSRPFLVGLTGGLASGKSTVAEMLRDEGLRVVDADWLVAELYRPGQPGARRVRELFGTEALTSDGAVDRRWLAERVFSDSDARRRLEQAVHPLVEERFREIAATHRGIVVVEATLLVEAGWGPRLDLVVTVEADPETRLRRAVARGMDEREARLRLAAQGDGGRRRVAAHLVVDNDGTLEELRERVSELAEEVRRRAG